MWQQWYRSAMVRVMAWHLFSTETLTHIHCWDIANWARRTIFYEIPSKIQPPSFKEIPLTHWGRVTHKCVGNLTIIGSDNGLSPCRRQAIIWTTAGMLLIGPNFSEILIGIETFSFKKLYFKTSSAKWRLFCLGLNELKFLQNGHHSALVSMRWIAVLALSVSTTLCHVLLPCRVNEINRIMIIHIDLNVFILVCCWSSGWRGFVA